MLRKTHISEWIVAGILSLLLIIYSCFFIQLNWVIIFPLILFILFSVVLPDIFFFSKKSFKFTPIKINSSLLIDFVLSLIATIILFLASSRTFFDDIGFTLRYLDNFDQGYFYCYNITDGPVFGSSGFFNTIFCGFLTYIHVLDPHMAMLFSNTLGVFLVSVLSLRILRIYFKKNFQVLLSWFLLIFCTKFFLNIAFSGIETPFHLSIILASIYFLLVDKGKLMWIFLALSIISKLDAVPVAVIIGLVYLVKNKQRLFVNDRNNVFLEFFIWSGLILLFWIVFMILVFGSPLPQSAFAKMHLYPHPETSWFPFLSNFTNDKYIFPILILSVFLFISHLSLVIIKKVEFKLHDLVFGFGFLASLLLYYFYNPGEKMMWYYTIPAYLMMFQLLISFLILSNQFSKSIRPVFQILFLSLLILFLRTDAQASTKWMKKSMNVVENERIKIGEYVGKISTENDTLISKHGHLSRYFKGYVIDNSGLNSKLASNYSLNTDSLLKSFRPQFAINHAWPSFINNMNQNNYKLSHAYYDIALFDSPNWLLFKRNIENDRIFYLKDLDETFFSGVEKVFDQKYTTRLRGESLILLIPEKQFFKSERLILGFIRRQSPYDIKISILNMDSLVGELNFSVEKIGRPNDISRFVKEIQIDLGEISHIKLVFRCKSEGKVVVINPFIEYVKQPN